jgi:hypothetical protein
MRHRRKSKRSQYLLSPILHVRTSALICFGLNHGISAAFAGITLKGSLGLYDRLQLVHGLVEVVVH